MTVRMQQRRGTAAQWTSANPVLADGEIGVETDTLRAKIGNGSTAWTALTYFTLENGSVDTAKLVNDAVTADKIAANAVGASELADNAVTPAKLATSGRFTFPTGAANGYGFTSGASHLSGTGSPEGVVTAAPGSTWLQTDSTTDVKGWIRWIKATGTGNTGWVAGPEADTGLRDMRLAPMSNGWVTTGGDFRLRRIGNLVYFSAAWDAVSATSDSACTLPNGFRPQNVTHYGVAHFTATAASSRLLEITTSGLVKIYNRGAGMHFLQATLVTADAWPATLP